MANPPRPRSQANLKWRLQAFASGISADPARYNISVEEAAEIQKAVDAFDEALSEATTETTRTRCTVNAKDRTRRIAEELHSRFYNIIKVDPTISDDDKIGIGVRPMNLERPRIGTPRTCPLLKLAGVSPHRHVLRFHDTSTPDASAKPRGAAFLQLYAAIGEERDQPVSEAREVGLFTRNPIMVGFDAEDNRKQATYYGRWISPRGKAGPWSLAVSMAVVA